MAMSNADGHVSIDAGTEDSRKALILRNRLYPDVVDSTSDTKRCLRVVRRELFFGIDVGVVALHFGRSLLGQETVELFDFILKAVSLEYCSVEAMVRDEASRTLRK